MTSIEEEKLIKNHILLKHKSPTNSNRKNTKLKKTLSSNVSRGSLADFLKINRIWQINI